MGYTCIYVCSAVRGYIGVTYRAHIGGGYKGKLLYCNRVNIEVIKGVI